MKQGAKIFSAFSLSLHNQLDGGSFLRWPKMNFCNPRRPQGSLNASADGHQNIPFWWWVSSLFSALPRTLRDGFFAGFFWLCDSLISFVHDARTRHEASSITNAPHNPGKDFENTDAIRCKILRIKHASRSPVWRGFHDFTFDDSLSVKQRINLSPIGDFELTFSILSSFILDSSLLPVPRPARSLYSRLSFGQKHLERFFAFRASLWLVALSRSLALAPSSLIS